METPLLGHDVERRQRERSRHMSDMADYLRHQIAQRLLNLENERQKGIKFDNQYVEEVQRHEEEYV